MKSLKLLWLAFLYAHVSPLLGQSLIETIDGVYVERDTTSVALKNQTIRDGDIIAFDIPGFGDYLAEERVLLRDVVLLFNNVPLSEYPAYVENLESGVLRFAFSEDALADEHRKLLYNLDGHATKKVQLGIKIGETALHYPLRANVFFQDIQNWSTVGWALIISFVLFFVLIVIKFPSLIKDNLPFVDNAATVKRNAAYSLGKTQMAYWTFLVIASFIYIWALTTDLHSINNTALILIGISSTTLAAASIIGKQKETEATKKNQELDLVQYRMTTGSFFADILSDANGVNINRFQVFIFNVVFGVAFLKSVIFDYSMPTFDETQLLLLGISSGTYIFLKTTENR